MYYWGDNNDDSDDDTYTTLNYTYIYYTTPLPPPPLQEFVGQFGVMVILTRRQKIKNYTDKLCLMLNLIKWREPVIVVFQRELGVLNLLVVEVCQLVLVVVVGDLIKCNLRKRILLVVPEGKCNYYYYHY